MRLDIIRKKWWNVLPYLWIFASYVVIDVWLRVMTRWINRYSIYSLEPNLFTVLWAVMLTVLVTIPKSRRAGRTFYGITYYLLLVYATVQYGSYLVLGNFLWVSDSLVRNTFRYSIANVFSDAGYNVNSFHAGAETFYNRSEIHQTFGYEQYHSYKNYPEIDTPTADDCFLTQSDPLYNEATGQEPFFSYVISFSAHLPYSDDDDLARYALGKYPQYDVQDDRELNILKAKARLTDDMVSQLIARLEEDGLLEDTVIAAFTDHYAYGLSDQEQLLRLSEEAGSSILERTPAFIYCADEDLPVTVDKVVQITDLAPTIMNLFGFDVPVAIMGQDIFDENYIGYAIFPDGTWLTSKVYVKNGVVIRNTGMSEDEIAQMNLYVQEEYQINDALLDTDYYKYGS